MILKLMLICVSAFLFQNAVGEAPKFRILAPPFVCPKAKDIIDKPDNTIVTLQTEAGEKVYFHWTVRWYPLVAPTQRFTLALWQTVRELELKLNEAQIEPNVFVINNTELLSGVKYIFNVTASTPGDNQVTEKVFHIDNIDGDPELLIEGRSDMFSVILIGGQMTYSDLDFMLEAQVTTCHKTHDYYFVWSVESGAEKVEVSSVKGSMLLIRGNTLTPGRSYDVLCQVYKYSNGDFITQTSLPFRVHHRDLSVNFNVDLIRVSINRPFSLTTDINNLDYLEDGTIVSWECTYSGVTVDTFYEIDGDGTMSFPVGLPDVGEYLVKVTVGVVGQTYSAQATARIIAVEQPLPVIQVHFIPRILNEDSVITLQANVSEVVPGCSLTWYFTSHKCLASLDSSTYDICENSEHGTPISSPVNFYSLEENFLSELTDYTNETGSKTVFAALEAAEGKARIAAECTCETENCTSKGTVYADVNFKVNLKPMAGYVMVMPETGTAMETIFRISTLAIVDTNRPLRYTFYCRLNDNDTLILGTYLEHLAVKTLLPYIGGGTSVWVEVCDSFGACSKGDPNVVDMLPGEARTTDALLEDARSHIKRCEIMMLQRLAMSAVVTYTNAFQTDALNKFSLDLLDALKTIDEDCVKENYNEYSRFLYWLARAGIHATGLM